MHPWHDYPIDESQIADQFPVVIEVVEAPLGVEDALRILRDAIESYRVRPA